LDIGSIDFLSINFTTKLHLLRTRVKSSFDLVYGYGNYGNQFLPAETLRQAMSSFTQHFPKTKRKNGYQMVIGGKTSQIAL